MRGALTGARSLLLATVLVPVVLLSGYFFPYVTTRNLFFRACLLLALALAVLGRKRWRHLIPREDRTLLWMSFYVLAMCVSALFGVSPWRSFFGEFERMGGIIAWIALLLFYFLMRALMTESWRTWFARAVLVMGDVSVIFSSSGSVPDSFSGLAKGVSAGSMMGNSGLLAAYLLLCLIFAFHLLITERRVWRLFATISAVILLTGIAFTMNRSSQLGLIAAAGVAAGTFFALSDRKRRLAGIYSAAGVGLVGLTAILTSVIHRATPAVSPTLLTRWIAFSHAPVDPSRIYEWKMALRGLLDRPLLGYGPENYQVIRGIHFDPTVYGFVGFIPYDRPHNAWLELLCTGGILGLLAMLGVWGSAIKTLRDGARSKLLRPVETALFAGAFAAYAVYLTFWFFDLNSTMLFVALLALMGAKVYGTGVAPVTAESPSPSNWLTIGAAETALAAALYLACVVPLRAASDLGTAVAPYETVSARLDGFDRALASAPQAARGLDFYEIYLGQLVSQFSEASPLGEQREELSRALAGAASYATYLIRHEPLNDHSYVERGRIEKLRGDFTHDPAYYAAAERDLRHAIAMSPRRAEIRAVLSNFYLASGDTLGAVAQLDTASILSPIFNASHLRLATVALARKPMADSVIPLRSRSRQGIRKRL